MQKLESKKLLHGYFYYFTDSSLTPLKLAHGKKLFYKLLKEHSLDIDVSQSTYVDCGASVGSEIVPLIERFGHVVAFEPHPAQYNVLQLNLMFRSNWTTHNCALSNYEGVSNYYNTELKTGACSSIVYDPKFKQRSSQDVQVKTLDSFSIDNVGFLKIDVEGAEYSLLQGAEETLKNNSPIIKIEISKNGNEVVELLRSFGYTPVMFDCSGLDYHISDDLTFGEELGDIVWKSNDTKLLFDHPRHTREKKT